MSADTTIPAINDQQATAILQEALNRGMYAGADGQIPEDPAVRMTDAEAFVAQAIRAHAAGNTSENVTAILFIAEVDQKPPVVPQVQAPQPPAVPQPPSPSAPLAPNPGSAAPPTAPAQQPAGAANFDLEQISDELLASMLQTLSTYVDSPAVQHEKALLQAELARRQGGTVAQAPSAPQVQPPAPPGAQAPSPPVPPGVVGAGDDQGPTGDNQGAQGQPADAGAQPGTEVAEPIAEAGSADAGQAPEEDAERAGLIAQLTVPILQAYGVGLDEIQTLSTENMQYMIANPNGQPGAPRIGSITAAPAESPTPPVQPTQAQPVSPGISPEREALEAQVTGPMLKAYGRGRRNVPDIGDNELALMVQKPDGSATAEELQAARVADGTAQPEVATAPVAPPQPPPTPEAPAPEPEPAPAGPPQQPPAQPPAPPATGGAQVLAEAVQQAEAQRQAEPEDGRLRALAIIGKENLPIPPEIEGDPPVLPNDLSKYGQDEIYSFHARFHACEARAAWVLSDAEDELDDYVKLRKAREVTVAAEIPPKIDRKNVTDEQRKAIVEADAEVQRLLGLEKETRKVVRKLKVLLDVYHRDAERCSRQMTRWMNELRDTPR